MRRRSFLKGLTGAALAPTVLATACSDESAERVPATASSTPTPNDAWPGYSDAIVIDALANPIQFNIPQSALPLAATDLDAIRRSGITAVNATVNVSGATQERPFERTVERMAAWEHEFDTHRDVIARVRSAADIEDAKRTGRLGFIHGFQDTTPYGTELDRVGLFSSMGVRIVQLTYNDTNHVGSGCLAASDDGLTSFGRGVVERLNALGSLVDLSHCGPATTREAIELSADPVSATHTGCSAVFEHPRNKSDDILRGIADGGGVVGIYLMPFLNAAGPPTLADVMAHVDHALNVCGEDHVGIGTDQGIVPLDTSGPFRSQFDAVVARRRDMGISAPREDTPPIVPELNEVRRMDLLAAAMAEHGIPTRVVEKILGSNFLRLFGDVWV